MLRHRVLIAVLAVTLLAMLSGLATAGSLAAPPPAFGEYVPDEVLVSLRPGADAAEVAHAVGARAERQTLLGAWVFKVPVGTVPRVVRALSRNPNVE